MSVLIEPPDDSEEVVIDLSAEQKEEVAEIDEIEGFLKEIAAINPGPQTVELQTTDPVLRADLEKLMKKSAEKKVDTKVANDKTMDAADKIMDDVGKKREKSTETNEQQRDVLADFAAWNEACGEERKSSFNIDRRPLAYRTDDGHIQYPDGTIREVPKDEIFARLDKDKHLSKENTTPERVEVALLKDDVQQKLPEVRVVPLEDVARHTSSADIERHRDKLVEMQVKLYDQRKKAEAQEKSNAPEIAQVEMSVSGRYTIKEKVGEFGFGVLYKAIDPVTKREVILKTDKLVDGQSLSDANNNVIVEALVNRQLNHPNIVRFEGVVQDDAGRLYLVLEYVQGAKRLDVKEPLSLQNIIFLGEKVANAVGHAHEQGIIHRDLKPENILIDLQGNPRIIDFGVAKLEEKVLRVLREMANSLTGSRFTDEKIVGTVKYMAPEVIEGQPPDAQSDVYSVGKILYQMALQSADAIPIGNVREFLEKKGAPVAFASCLAKATEKEECRHTSMKELEKDLEGVLTSSVEVKKVEVVAPVEKKEVKIETKYEGFVKMLDGGWHGFKKGHYLELAAEFAEYLNRIAVAFGSKIDPTVQSFEFTTVEEGGLVKRTKTSQVKALTSSAWKGEDADTLVPDENKYLMRINVNDQAQKMTASIILTHQDNIIVGVWPQAVTQEDTPEISMLKYFAEKMMPLKAKLDRRSLGSAWWYTHNVLDCGDKPFNSKHYLPFERGRALYSVDDVVIGYAHEFMKASSDNLIKFRKGFVRRTPSLYWTKDLINLGDRYVLIPGRKQA